MSQSRYFLIDGYWRDDREEFSGYLVKEFHDEDENDDDVFFYGLSEEHIIQAIADGEKTGEDFVITSYSEC